MQLNPIVKMTDSEWNQEVSKCLTTWGQVSVLWTVSQRSFSGLIDSSNETRSCVNHATNILNDMNQVHLTGGFPLKDRVNNLEARAGDLEGYRDRARVRAGNLETRAGNLETKVGDLEAKVGDLEGYRDRARVRATNLETRATNLETRATNLETRATNLETRATNLETRATNLEGDVADLNGRLTTDVNNLQIAKVNWEKKFTELEDDVLLLKMDVHTIQTKSKKMNPVVNTNEDSSSKRDDLAARVDALFEEEAVLKNIIKVQAGTIENLENQQKKYGDLVEQLLQRVNQLENGDKASVVNSQSTM